MNKKHWITLESGELGERPVGPHTYGTGTRAAR